MLKLTAKGAQEGGGASTASSASTKGFDSAGSTASASESTDRGPDIAGLVAALGLAAAGFAAVRSRSAGSRAE